MQAFVPDFECDLFISSARADAGSSPESGEQAAWTRDLFQGLQLLLAQKLGRRDWGRMVAPAILPEAGTEKAIRRSAALLVVLTHEYLRDSKCLDELSAYLATLGGAEPYGRLFVVLADAIERSSWPAELQSHLAFEFLTAAKGRDSESAPSAQRLQLSDKLYPIRLDDLSMEIANCLERRRADAEGQTRADAPSVFLGSASPDVEELRDSMRRYLIQEGFRIVPNCWYPQELAEWRESALRDMQTSQLLVQLLGKQPTPDVPGTALGRGELELELAAEAGISVLSWRDPRLEPDDVVDDRHRRLLESQYVLAVGIEEFKRKVVEYSTARIKKPVTASDKPLVVVAASDVDRVLAQQVGELLGSKGLGIEIPDTEEFPWELYSNGKQGVGGLVIVYGECPAIWVRQQLWKYRKAMARTESRPPLCAVCEGPPQTKEPLRYDVPQMDLIDCRVQLTESALSSFVEAVQRRCRQ